MRSSDEISLGQRLLRQWRRWRRIPGGARLFSRMVGRMAPYTGTIGARVLELEPGRARLELRDRRRLRNHLRSIHAIAQANLGEVATGLAMLTLLPPGVRGIPTHLAIDYVKKARGRLVVDARCEPPGDIADEADHWAHADIRDAGGDTVSRIAVRWRLRREQE
jgi:acyl-coenzyme A thioesterase PaaI-like protein